LGFIAALKLKHPTADDGTVDKGVDNSTRGKGVAIQTQRGDNDQCRHLNLTLVRVAASIQPVPLKAARAGP